MPKPKPPSARPRSWLALPVLLLALPLLAACKDEVQAARPAAPPPPVSVIRLQPESVAIRTVLPGRTAPYQVAEIRPQVSGLLQEKLFREGAAVEAAQPLFQIDPAPYRAALASAEANQARAEATLQDARATTSRYRPLVGQNAVSRMAYDKAIATQAQAEAEVAGAKAAVQSARIDLERTRITSPISGRTGRSNLTVGALVTANQAAELLTVTQLDPILVDVTQPAEALLRLRREMQEGLMRRGEDDTVEVRLALGDGTEYPLPGRLQFAEATVDRDTGSVTMRAVFPNPDGMLMPGMFVRARLEAGVAQNALLVPQQAVTRNARGEATTLVVDEQGAVRQRVIETRQAIGNQWLVTSGLSAGERVVVQGMQRVRDGVKPEVREITLQELEQGRPALAAAQARG
ncbi:efflux RND transporter periplasmic adaptor subunit [Roseomonas marmotae]|uniref:Efflux RND transporter periplasmic adaptor subunit n=1 Tax=Roseomonas marmotae TaxID=2768161 RepID=A0ABS3KAP9_9PROT|nr:efflux RND transporter periplasmic adaptor subunit [Roseomonas marmotae]MBO1074548.1 efflux RND transporter periplasmic adaptor subunit [Roseomonas marmotae]QTI81581.1 efflux RND transporter periplasmic adaptor subunit [Roseomonas marmotae]